jgi:hypothetical protein
MDYKDIVMDFFHEVRKRGGGSFIDQDFRVIIGQVFYDKVKAAIEEEREACAKTCEEGIETARIVKAEGLISIDSVMKTLAKKIRARSS